MARHPKASVIRVPSSLSGDKAAVDDQFGAGDKRRFVGGQKQHTVGDLEGFADAPQRVSYLLLCASGSGCDDRMGGMKPGCTELARMPLGPYCTAVALVKMRTAPLEA